MPFWICNYRHLFAHLHVSWWLPSGRGMSWTRWGWTPNWSTWLGSCPYFLPTAGKSLSWWSKAWDPFPARRRKDRSTAQEPRSRLQKERVRQQLLCSSKGLKFIPHPGRTGSNREQTLNPCPKKCQIQNNAQMRRSFQSLMKGPRKNRFERPEQKEHVVFYQIFPSSPHKKAGTPLTPVVVVFGLWWYSCQWLILKNLEK